MKKLILASAVVAAFAGSYVHAEEAAAPDHQFAFNVGATSDYRFRGISQSQKEPAFFAGADYTNAPTGLYVGVFTSTIKWVRANGGSADMEFDIYGGKRGALGPVSYDVGLIRYYYPDNQLPPPSFASANTSEAYVQLGYGPAYIKYSQALTNFVGFVDSKGSRYIDVGANLDLFDGYQLNLHAGHQSIEGAGNTAADYSDWKVGVTKDFGVVVASLAAVGTNADRTAYTWDTAKPKFVGSTGAVLTLTKNF